MDGTAWAVRHGASGAAAAESDEAYGGEHWPKARGVGILIGNKRLATDAGDFTDIQGVRNGARTRARA